MIEVDSRRSTHGAAKGLRASETPSIRSVANVLTPSNTANPCATRLFIPPVATYRYNSFNASRPRSSVRVSVIDNVSIQRRRRVASANRDSPSPSSRITADP